MTNLRAVTITGADDKTDIKSLLSLSVEFPFVEWGILVSRKQEGSFRFPSREWIERFSSLSRAYGLSLSMHVCGLWVRKMLIGELDWDELPYVVQVAQRIQINTHAEPHVSTTGLISSLRDAGRLWKEVNRQEVNRQFIFQWDGVNDHLAYAAKAYGLDVAALFDTSGGAGVVPNSWPSGISIPCGYAGGLGPDNVVHQLELIEERCKKPFWIDMERRVRTEDDSTLDLDKVRAVLLACKEYMAR